MINTDNKTINEILDRGVVDVHIRKDLEKKLKSGKKLRIKFGIDPTGSDLHIGHAVVLKKLKHFQDAGHQVILLIGDYTAKIGDPTGRTETRKILTDDQIKENMKNYTDQAGLILDMDKIEVRYNSEWLAKLEMAELLQLTSIKTVAQILHRSDFKKRMKEDIDISLSEFLYPIMQGYDSVELKADVELGGTEQTFNMLVGRDLQKYYEQIQQDVMTVPILEGLDGVQKMSKSYDNYIGLTDTPEEMFGKVMSIPDDLITKYLELATEVSLDEIKKIEADIKSGANPMEYKKFTAKEIIKIYHDEAVAEEAEAQFTKVFSEHKLPDDMPTLKAEEGDVKVIDIIVDNEMASSKSEARRLLEQGAVKLDQEKVTDEIMKVSGEHVLQVGKRRFLKIIVKG
jgi:tyrosyl-tRNA synthetase